MQTCEAGWIIQKTNKKFTYITFTFYIYIYTYVRLCVTMCDCELLPMYVCMYICDC